MCDAIQKIFSDLNVVPEKIQTDNGTEFKNSELETFCKEQEIKKVHSLPYKPSTQGGVERNNGTIKRLVNTILLAKASSSWENEIEKVVQDLNNRKHAVTKTIPIEVWNLFNKNTDNMSNHELLEHKYNLVKITEKITSKLKRQSEKDTKRRAKGKVTVTFEVGQTVLVAIPQALRRKDDYLFCRKGEIKEIRGNTCRIMWLETGGMYRDEKPGLLSKRMIHFKDLKHYHQGVDKLLSSYQTANYLIENDPIPENYVTLDNEQEYQSEENQEVQIVTGQDKLEDHQEINNEHNLEENQEVQIVTRQDELEDHQEINDEHNLEENQEVQIVTCQDKLEDHREINDEPPKENLEVQEYKWKRYIRKEVEKEKKEEKKKKGKGDFFLKFKIEFLKINFLK
jgi:hypothetical protein